MIVWLAIGVAWFAIRYPHVRAHLRAANLANTAAPPTPLALDDRTVPGS
jgi:hypothetical protein